MNHHERESRPQGQNLKSQEIARLREALTFANAEIARLKGKQADTIFQAELKAVLKQELGIEGLVTTYIQSMRSKVPDTNILVFLPRSGDEYSLAGYLSRDIDPDEFHEACAALGRDIEEFATDFNFTCAQHPVLKGMDVFFGKGFEGGEDLCAVLFFRDKRGPMHNDQRHMIELSLPLLAQQVAVCIRTHHRHLPQDQWGQPKNPWE